jgi:ABC-type multidrug transport system fused ATPase/permease subunit
MIDSYLKRYRYFKQLRQVGQIDSKSFVYIALTRLIKVGLAMVSPLIMKYYIDHTLGNKDYNSVYWILVIIGVIFLISSFNEIISVNHSNKVKHRFIYHAKLNVWKKLMNVHPGKILDMDLGELKLIMHDDIEDTSGMLVKQIIDFITNHLMFVCSIVVLSVISWQMAVISILILVLSNALESFISKSVYGINNEARSLKKTISNWLIEYFSYKKDIRILGIQDMKKGEFEDLQKKKVDLEYRRIWRQYLPSFVCMGNFNTLFVSRILIFFICGLLILENKITVGYALAITKYFAELMLNLNEINQKNLQFSQEVVSVERLLRALELFEDDLGEKKINLSDHSLHLEMTLGEDAQSFTVKSGESIAFIGSKNQHLSIINKLMLEDLREDYKINGVNWRELDINGYYKDIGVGMHCYQFFNMSIKDNLLISNPKATDDEIKRACEFANIHQVIESFPEKYNTVIGENGSTLSGGQKQLLAIARIFLKDPPVIILHDAFSAVDTVSQHHVIKHLHELKNKKLIYSGADVKGLEYFGKIIK